MASTAALDHTLPLLILPAPRTAPPGWRTWVVVDSIGRAGFAMPKRKAPPRGGASPIHFNRSYLLAEAVHQAALDAQVILLCAAKVRVQILELDGAESQVTRNCEVRAATERHRERIR
ncbi:MAG: hypothetical protein JWO71_4199 [Candidatus Acidoferrum typicum]|nr:hypothetical protein [Candidatus Acidoferrum typicum]